MTPAPALSPLKGRAMHHHAPVVDPNDDLDAETIAELCDADRHARRDLVYLPSGGSPESVATLRAAVRLYGDVLPGDDLDDLDPDDAPELPARP